VRFLGVQDRTVTPLGNGAYQHWGGPNEPNQARVGLCAVSNASLTYTNAWGWADTMCNNTFVFICRVQRKDVWTAPESAALSAPRAAFHLWLL
jgi:hypothetical protein